MECWHVVLIAGAIGAIEGVVITKFFDWVKAGGIDDVRAAWRKGRELAAKERRGRLP